MSTAFEHAPAHQAQRVTAETLDGLVEFFAPFVIVPSPDGPMIESPVPGIRTPESVTIRERDLQVLVDDEEPGRSAWEPVTGCSNQHGYAGPVMHASEYLGGGMARDMIAVDGPTTYVVTAVFAEGEELDEFAEPAGWILLRLRDQA